MMNAIKDHLVRGEARIYHEVHGPEKAPVLLLSHAFGASSAMWRAQIKPLAQTWRIITWDMRGHGLTKTPEASEHFSHQLTLEDMTALLEHYAPDHAPNQAPKAVIGGLSLGGYLSLMFAFTQPQNVRALLICDSGPGFKNDEAREKWNQTAHRQADALEKRGLGAAPKVPEGVRHLSATSLALAARFILTQNNDDVIQRLDQLRVPTLIVVGADDKPFQGAADYMERKIPDADKVVIPNAEHYANDDNPETFNAAVLDFLNTLR